MHCLQHGTHLGWLIDPDEQTIFIHSPKQPLQIFDLSNQHEKLPVPTFAEVVNLTLKQVMDWLLE